MRVRDSGEEQKSKYYIAPIRSRKKRNRDRTAHAPTCERRPTIRRESLDDGLENNADDDEGKILFTCWSVEER